MTEAYTDLEHTMLYYGDDEHDGAHFTFNFFLVTSITAESNAKDLEDTINIWLDNIPEGRVSNWVVSIIKLRFFNFFTNQILIYS